ncbi:MAG: radical SAM protein [Candidatus Helarchaeota archaeon]|nr:radical SAM protein [Candidatus Helarchaeota archaeon]
MNTIRKDFRKVEIKIALCYPNLYQAGIACYAIQLIYTLFNSYENIQCERFYYTPKKPPLSIESGQPLKNFEIICFSLQYELDYMNMLEILSFTGLPIASEKRTSHLIVAGGPCALENPLPLSSFVDIFVLGDLEPILDQFIFYLSEYKKGHKDLHDFLDIPGLFIPKYHEGEKIPKIVTKDLNDYPHPTKQIVSEASSFGKSLLLEVTRGCPRGCRFCLIGYQGLPMRVRSLSTLKQIILDGIEYSKVDKISLIGSSLSDYPHLKELCAFIGEQSLNLSLPSMRIDTFSEQLLELLNSLGVKTISIAPEAGSSRLRSAIGKTIPEEILLDSLAKFSNAQIANLKMYFLINLPTETPQDIEAIQGLLNTVTQKYYPPKHIHLSINPFIPKPHTPFQWEPPISLIHLQKIIKSLQKHIKKLKIYDYNFLDPRWARIQGILSRGTEFIGELLVKILQNGGSLGAWRKILKEENYSIEKSQKFRPTFDEDLPWDFIEVNVAKKKLLILYQKTHD